MKKQLLSTLAMAFLSLTLGAQTYDAPRPVSTNTISTPHLEDKAGSYGQYCGLSLANNVVDNNGNDGVMFKVRAKENIYINGFSTAVAIGSATNGYYRIYKKAGTYVGFETNPSAWVLIDSGFVTPNGGIVFTNGNPDAYVSAGSEVSFYLTGTGQLGTNYKDGVTEGAVLSENTDLILYEGKGVEFPFGNNFAPRNFVGKIHYCKPSQFVCDTTVTQYQDANGNAGVFFNVASKSKAITIDNIFMDVEGKGLSTFFLYTKSGTFEGSETTPSAWTLVDTIQLSNPINNSPLAISPQGFSLIIPPNSVQGFHIVNNNNILLTDYLNGVTVNDTIRNEAFIAVTGGKGADAPFSDNGLPRKFDGTISYCVDNTGIHENETIVLNVFPNPATGYITINTGNAAIQQIQVIDVSGKVVINTNSQANSEYTTLDVSELVAGSYFIKVISKTSVSTKAFIKQ